MLTLTLAFGCASIPGCYALPVSKSKNVAEYTANSTVEGMLDVAVVIKARDPDTDEPDRIVGSGVVVQHKKGKRILVLTAKHVADAVSDKMYVTHCTGKCDKDAAAHTIRREEKYDLALIATDQVAATDGPEVTLATTEPSVGDELYIVGSPNGHHFNVSRGILSSVYVTEETERKYYRTDAAVYFGNSGGGAFNEDGELVAIVVQLEAMGLLGIMTGIVPGSGALVPLDKVWFFLYGKPLN